MKAKKIAALALSSTMCLAMATPAFAATKNTTKITSTYQEVPIAVTVPTTGTATINPYGLPVKVMSTNTEGDKKELASISGQKITTQPMAIYSKTEVGLLVSATVTGEIKGETLKLTTAAIPEGATTNSVLMYLETKTSAKTDVDLALADSTTKFGPFEGWDATNDTKNTSVSNEVANWAATEYDATARNQILVGTTAKSKTGIGYLSAAKDTITRKADGTVDADATDGDGVLDLQAGGAMWFRLAGDVVATPKTAWTKMDGVTVTVAFTFAPTDNAGAPGKITGDLKASTAKTLSVGDFDGGKAKLTFSDSATYAWTVEGPDGSTVEFSTTEGETENDPTPKVTVDTAGDYKVTLTVKENNVPYIATATITAAA